MIGDNHRLQENDDLYLWRAQAVKKKPPCFNARANPALNYVQKGCKLQY